MVEILLTIIVNAFFCAAIACISIFIEFIMIAYAITHRWQFWHSSFTKNIETLGLIVAMNGISAIPAIIISSLMVAFLVKPGLQFMLTVPATIVLIKTSIEGYGIMRTFPQLACKPLYIKLLVANIISTTLVFVLLRILPYIIFGIIELVITTQET